MADLKDNVELLNFDSIEQFFSAFSVTFRYEGYRDRGEDFGRRRDDYYDRRDDYRREDR